MEASNDAVQNLDSFFESIKGSFTHIKTNKLSRQKGSVPVTNSHKPKSK